MAPLLKNVRFRIILLAVAWVPIIAGFFWRAYHVQIERHAELKEKARIKYSAKVKITGKRGEIFDFDGNLLVTNVPRVTIAVSPYAAVYEAFLHYEKSRNKKRYGQLYISDRQNEKRERRTADEGGVEPKFFQCPRKNARKAVETEF